MEPDLIVCGHAANVPEALRDIATSGAEVAVVDLSLKGASGLELIKDLKVLHPSVRVLVFSMHNDLDYVERALLAGAICFVDKQDAIQNIIIAIRRALKGECYISAGVAERLAERKIRSPRSENDLPRLSDRELEVFQSLAEGCELGQIAATLHLSIKTVHTYCDRLRQKMNLRTERDLLVEAVRWRERQCHEANPTCQRITDTIIS